MINSRNAGGIVLSESQSRPVGWYKKRQRFSKLSLTGKAPESDTPSTFDGDESAASFGTGDGYSEHSGNSHRQRDLVEFANRSWSSAYQGVPTHTCDTHAVRRENSRHRSNAAFVDAYADRRSDALFCKPAGDESNEFASDDRNHNRLAYEDVPREIEAPWRDMERETRVRIATRDRRAALDSLLRRKGAGRSASQFARGYASAPSSPALASLHGRDIPSLSLEEDDVETLPEPQRPYSAPVSPIYRSSSFAASVEPSLFTLAVPNAQVNDNTARRPADTLSTEDIPVFLSLDSTTLSEWNFAKGKSRVSFSNVQVRSYERILGDNPSCVSGPSISIGWNYDEDSVVEMNVNDYEEEREYLRCQGVPMLSRYEREELLFELGYKQADLAKAIRLSNKIKNRRKQTVTNLYAAKAEEVVEDTARFVKKGLSLGLKKNNKLWKHSTPLATLKTEWKT